MLISIGVNVLNVVFSLAAVYALGMGFVGIAVGTVAAEYAGLALSLGLLWKRQSAQGGGHERRPPAAWRQPRHICAQFLDDADKFVFLVGRGSQR